MKKLATLLAAAAMFTACSETEVEVLETKTVTYSVSGDDMTHAVAYSDRWANDPVQPYLSAGEKIINLHDGYGELSFEALPGDSISLFVLDASYLNHRKIANVTITVGNIVVARGNTEETGLLIVHGNVGADLFKSCEK